ncbi:hypothetical protein RFI_06641 [Reticulomyxa filosa]|uniref:SAM domain-containing protein n=1 Tax=Reticulomyxa filosa TaxID=46433 RepID=X6NXD6_RETFI|nr:hypothetical protein RFI_06641 [Reticulomyxa filosa]|eukprot:ETO30484.1 hypothetical protein RFI_06641 [Reticulomyxa filosa]
MIQFAMIKITNIIYYISSELLTYCYANERREENSVRNDSQIIKIEKYNHIDGSVLIELTSQDFASLGIKSIGHQKKLQRNIQALLSHKANLLSSEESLERSNTSNQEENNLFRKDVTLEMLRQKMRKFVEERNWEQFHTPRNVLLALTGELGELCEIFQWKGEVEVGLKSWKANEMEHLGEELSDVLLYLVRLADLCNVDLGSCVLDKMQKKCKKISNQMNQCQKKHSKLKIHQVKPNKACERHSKTLAHIQFVTFFEKCATEHLFNLKFKIYDFVLFFATDKQFSRKLSV